MLDLLLVAGVVAAVENAAKHLGVECLDASAENRRVAGKVFNRFAFVSQTVDK